MGRRLTNNEFIRKSKEVHDDKYDYSLSEYINNDKKIKIICSFHGVFEQIPGDHMRGQSCPKCRTNYRKPDKNFIEKSIKKHGDKYDYSLTEYKGNNINIKIICPIHGIFEQLPLNHTKGCICPKCANVKQLTTDEFIEKAKNIHGNRYDYSFVEYKNLRTKVKIKCLKHGFFYQEPVNHVSSKAGCPFCRQSKGEEKINQFLINNDLKYIPQKTFNGCKYKQKLQFDFYLSDYNMCIEYDGIQHHESVEYFGGIESLKLQKKKDSIKNKFCRDNNISLIRIKYNENTTDKLNNLIKKQ